MADGIEESFDVGVQYPVHRLALDAHREGVQRIVLSPPGPEPIGEAEEVRLVDRIENLHHRALDDLVLQCGDAERALPSVRFRDVGTARRLCPVGAPVDAAFKVAQPCVQALPVGAPRHPVHTRRGIPLQPVIGLLKQRRVDVVQQGGELFRFPFACDFAYAVDPR